VIGGKQWKINNFYLKLVFLPRFKRSQSLRRQKITAAFSAYSPSLDIIHYAPVEIVRSETIIHRYSCKGY